MGQDIRLLQPCKNKKQKYLDVYTQVLTFRQSSSSTTTTTITMTGKKRMVISCVSNNTTIFRSCIPFLLQQFFLFVLIFVFGITTTTTKTNVINAQEDSSNPICFMLYQMADNNLEYFINQDLEELMEAPGLRSSNSNLITWIYFDGRNLENNIYTDITTPIQNLYYADGSLVTEKLEGSYYITYQHSTNQMIINTTFSYELNSDHPDTIENFLTTAMQDCVTKSTTEVELEYFLLFSSHGGGVAGFGGDDNEIRRKNRRAQRRQLQLQNDDDDSFQKQQQQYHLEEGKVVDNLGNQLDRDLQRNAQATTTTDDTTTTTTTTDLQPNQYIIQAIKNSLNAVPDGPNQLNVLAFDACSMSDVGAIDEYRDVTQYIMASIAVIPGHGYAYFAIEDTSSALNLAKNIHTSYLEETQDTAWFFQQHQTPKTLAIMDTSLFTTFLTAWDEFAFEMTSLLQKDAVFFSTVNRVRSNTLSFEGYGDDLGSTTPSLMDVGHFLRGLQDLCQLRSGTTFQTLYNTVYVAYNNTFIVTGYGPGTADTTGMGILWPLKQKYKSDPEFYNTLLFDTSGLFATGDAPNWLVFLQTFYDTTIPTTTSSSETKSTNNSTSTNSSDATSSVCQSNLISDLVPTVDGQLFLNPTLSYDDNKEYLIFQSDITINTDYVTVDFGINITHILYTRRMQEKMYNYHDRQRQRQLQLQQQDEEHYRNTEMKNKNSIKRSPRSTLRLRQQQERQQYLSQQNQQQQLHRSMQQGGDDLFNPDTGNDFYFVYGGSLYLQYDGFSVAGVYDGNYYYITDSIASFTDILYVVNNENSEQKSFPVCYFPPGGEQKMTSELLEDLYTVEETMVLFGCIEAEIYFSTPLVVGESSFTLFVYNNELNTFNEITPLVGGQISPVVYVDLYVGGKYANEIVGGFYSTVLNWDMNMTMEIIQRTDAESMDYYGTDTGIMNAYAFDFDLYTESAMNNNNDATDYFEIITFPYKIGSVLTSNTNGGSSSSAARMKGYHVRQLLVVQSFILLLVVPCINSLFVIP